MNAVQLIEYMDFLMNAKDDIMSNYGNFSLIYFSCYGIISTCGNIINHCLESLI